MSKTAVSVCLMAMGAFLLGSSYIAGALYGSSYHQQVGRLWPASTIAPLVIAGWFLLAAGAVLLVVSMVGRR